MRFVLTLLFSSVALAGQFTTSLGDTYPYSASAIATDAAGNTYVVGSRLLPASPHGLPPPADIFLSKIDPNGSVLFTNTLGGNGTDVGTAIALDPSGNIYIAGTTTAPDFPLIQALQSQPGVSTTGFVMKLSNDGSTILYSTYFGGALGASSISSIATDTKGNLYLTGGTASTDFPQTSGLPKVQFTNVGYGLGGTMVAEISPAGDNILYSAVLPTGPDNIEGATPKIALDASANAYIIANTANPNLPITTGTSRTNGGAFIAKINAAGAGLGYLTYLPGSTAVTGVAVDASGHAYVIGYSSNFPATSGSLQSAQPTAVYNGFLAELNPTASAFLWATYLPGDCEAFPQSLTVDAGGGLWTTGSIESNCTFPNTNGWTTGTDFLIGVNAAGTQLTYSALYPRGSSAQSIAVDPSGTVHVAGADGVISAILPTASATTQVFGFQNAFGGNLSARISPAEVIAIYGPGIGPATALSATPANGSYPATLGGVQVAVNGVNIPLLYVSANQINAVVPMELSANSSATVRVTKGASITPGYPVWIVPTAPIVNPTVLNQDGTINSQTNPAHGGSIVTFYATGWQSNFRLADGQIATVAQDACLGACQATATYYTPPVCVGFCFARPAAAASFTISATVLYGGDAPGLVAGVTQFNVQLGAPPPSSGTNPLVLYVTNSLTNAAVSQGVYVAP